jgi:hypothetical protein
MVTRFKSLMPPVITTSVQVYDNTHQAGGRAGEFRIESLYFLRKIGRVKSKAVALKR